MIYKVGMLCKHFKGKDLIEKNIYRIEKLGVRGIDIDESTVTYTGEKNLKDATNLVVYSNIFQEGKLFCREYEDISSELSDDKKAMYNQEIRVQPITSEEESIISEDDFIENKKEYVLRKFSKN
ncbi:MAG: hypothetical protein IKF47_02610 [Bacilli bacterium]|nr:hypothetical protein [Bacilli bacterium]